LKNKAAFTAFCLILCLYATAQAPTADFTSDITGGCAPIVVNFKDLSTGNPTAWAWDFGNGGTSNKQNPSATYFYEGTYEVKLTVANLNGSNTITKTTYITVYKEPAAEFTVNSRTGCTPAHMQFTDMSTTSPGTTINGWKWDFGDGGTSTQQNPTYIYKTPGNYTVTLTITNDKGCKSLVTKPNYVNIIQGVVPGFSNSNPTECAAPSRVQFTNTSTGPGVLTYQWNFGDGKSADTRNASNIYQTNGTYPVTLIVSSSIGCTDSIRKSVEIGKVNSAFTVPENICPKTPVQFVNNSAPRPIKSLWRFSDGRVDTLRNPIVSFSQPGTYTVTLVNTFDICTDSLTKTFTVLPVPKINFVAPDTGKCAAPFTVTFNNTTTDAVSYQWDFGDGSAPVTDANPSHTYNSAGAYNVSLIAVGANGCADTLVQESFIEITKPIIQLPGLPRGGCLPYTTKFEASITSPDAIVSYQWNFGDGGTSSEESPTYTYTTKGTYDVTLTITTKGGCTETLRIRGAIKVGNKPDPLFIAEKFEGCAYRDIQFINQTIDTTQPPLEYLWQFSDGSTSTETNPKHIFIGTGQMDVTLTAIDNGCENTLTKVKYVNVLPAVSKFDYQPNCNNRNEYTFIDKSIGAVTWLWDFGNGVTSTQRHPGSHIFPGPGTYKVTLTTTAGGNTCEYVLTREIKIQSPTPNFTANTREGCKGFRPTFTASVTNPGLIKKYIWNFGDGTTLDAGNVTTARHAFTKPGTYNVTLTVIDSFNCETVITKGAFIRVNGPQAGFTSLTNTGCRGMTATFTDTSVTDGRNAIVNWRWDYGDSTVETFNNLTPFRHTYDTIGDFNIKLVVRDAAGCTDSVTYNEFVKVSNTKAAWTIPNLSCPSATNTFRGRTTSDFKYTTTWQFANNVTLTGTNVNYAFTDTGFFSVKMKVRDELGCEDSLYLDSAIRVSVPKAAFDANNFTTYCTPFEAKFTNQSTFYNSSLWSLGPGKGTSTQTNPNTYYTATGAYPIKLVVTSPGGCKDSVTQMFNVFNPEDGAIKYGPLLGCRPLRVNMEAFTKMKGQFIWDFGDGNVTDTTDHIISHSYQHLGSFVPRIILIQPEGCKVPLVGKETIEIIGARAQFQVDRDLFCDSGMITLTDSTLTRDPVQSYTWNFGDGTTSNDPLLANHIYTKPGNYDVSLIVSTTTGCSDTAYFSPVRVVESPSISITGDTEICVNDFVNYQGLFNRVDTSAVTWRWTMPNGTISTAQSPGVSRYINPGQFNVQAIATNSSGCTDTASQMLTVHALPYATIQSPLQKQVGVPVTISPTYTPGIVSYNWTPAATLNCATCPTPVASPKFNTRYDLVIVDSNGCRNTAFVQVNVFCENADVFIPNTFSPNGDGSNDVFYVRGKGLDRVKSLRIFNRWGQVVFEKRDFAVNDPSVGWDGTFKGQRPQSDVYIYQVEVFCENSQVIRFEGNVALIL